MSHNVTSNKIIIHPKKLVQYKTIQIIIINSNFENINKLIIGAEIKNKLKEYFVFLSTIRGKKRINTNMMNLSGLDLINLHSDA